MYSLIYEDILLSHSKLIDTATGLRFANGDFTVSESTAVIEKLVTFVNTLKLDKKSGHSLALTSLPG